MRSRRCCARPAGTRRPLLGRPPETEIAGDWELRIDFLQGSRVHRLNLEQRGPELAGHQLSTHFEGPVSGWLNGDQIQLSFTSRYEGSTICYFFDGQIRDGHMGGTAMLKPPATRTTALSTAVNSAPAAGRRAG